MSAKRQPRKLSPTVDPGSNNYTGWCLLASHTIIWCISSSYAHILPHALLHSHQRRFCKVYIVLYNNGKLGSGIGRRATQTGSINVGASRPHQMAARHLGPSKIEWQRQLRGYTVANSFTSLFSIIQFHTKTKTYMLVDCEKWHQTPFYTFLHVRNIIVPDARYCTVVSALLTNKISTLKSPKDVQHSQHCMEIYCSFFSSTMGIILPSVHS